MWKYVLNRMVRLIPTFIAVSFLVFSLMSLTGDPARTMLGETATEQELEMLREELGLNEPLPVRYAEYMWNLLHGDLGETLFGRSVWNEFAARFPNSVKLAIAGMLVTVLTAIPLGIISAVKQNTLVDTSLSALAMAGISMPSFWLGLLLVSLFAVTLEWLPATGAEGWKSIIMPAICAGVNNASLVARMTRSSMVDVIRADYLRTARAKGVGEREVVLKHALKNALIPIITIVGSQFSILIGGTVVIESVFAWPGIGQYIVTSIRGNDFNAVTGCIIILTVFVALVLLCVDILYAFADPRIKARYTRK